MSQSGYTPILIYASGTATNVPLAANLTSSASGAELALNYADGKLYYKSSAGVVTLLASSGGASGTFSSITNTGLTSGRVVYSTTGGLETDSANLLFDGTTLTANAITSAAATALTLKSAGTTAVTVDTSQNVGIGGTIPPSSPKLSLYGGIRFMSTEAASSTYTGIGSIVSDNVSISTVGTEKVRIDNNGNVGIGTTATSGVRLFTYANSGWAGTFYANSGGASTTGLSLYGITFGGNYSAGSAEVNIIYGTGGAGLDFSSYNGTTVTQRMRIDSSGNVNIGGTSGNGKLNVITGNINLSDDYSLTFGTQGAYLNGSTASNYLRFYTNSTERMRLDSSGNVGIGTTSPNAGAKLHLYSSAVSNAGILRIQHSSSSYNSGLVLLNGNSTNGGNLFIDGVGGLQLIQGDNNYLVFGTNNTERMRIDSNGNVLMGTNATFDNVSYLNTQVLGGLSTKIAGTGSASQISFFNDNGRVGYIGTSGTTTSYNTSSDYRLKENIQSMTGALAIVQQLKPVTYKWKADGSNGQGFIAHELQAIVPDCVSGDKDAVDAENNPLYQGVDTSFLIATLTAAIQEQQALITSLTARIEALEAK